MKKLKLGFADTHDHLAKFFFDVLSTRYDVEVDNKYPEFLIFGDKNFGTRNQYFSKNDVTKIFYTGENQRPEDYDCHYAISFDHNFNPWHYRLPLFVIYMWAWENIHGMKYTMDHIFQLDSSVPAKDSFCSFVVSNPNCQQRNDFFSKLNAIKPVDSGGRLFNNTGKELSGEQAKIDFLSTRKFNICFEPFEHPGYVTEKIMHAFYARTVPIYWGSDTIASDFNPNAFINVKEFNRPEDAIEYILQVDADEDAYMTYLQNPPFANNLPPSYMFLDNFLNWFDAVVYNKILSR
jgi:hypothetical protein